MPPEIKPVTVSQPEPWYTPFRLQLLGGYSNLKLGNGAPSFSGAQFQASVGRSFELSPRNHLFVQPAVRLHFLKSQNKDPLSIAHFGLEGGYETHLIPKILNLFFSLGIGADIFYSPGINLDPSIHRLLNNESTIALTFGGGINFVKGMFILKGGYKLVPGLKVPDSRPGIPAQAFNGRGGEFLAGIDAVKLSDWAGLKFPKLSTFKNFAEKLELKVAAEGSYTYNFKPSSTGEIPLRVYDKTSSRPIGHGLKFFAQRPADKDNPVGFEAVFLAGEDSAVSCSLSAFCGKYYDLQRLNASVYFGYLKLVAGLWATYLGSEVLDRLVNNHLSYATITGYGQPYKHLGVAAELNPIEKMNLVLAYINGSDNVLNRDQNIGPGLLGYLKIDWKSNFATSLGFTVGSQEGQVRSVLDFVLNYQYRDSTAKKQDFDRVTVTANYDWGHRAPGNMLTATNYHAFSISSCINFNPQIGICGRFEDFFDKDGTQTNTKQNLMGGTVTFNFRPGKFLPRFFRKSRLYLEYSSQRSNQKVFFDDVTPVKSQNTLGFGFGIELPPGS